MIEDAYPLSWPMATPRTPPGRRRRADFGRQVKRDNGTGYVYKSRESLTIAQAIDRLQKEMGAFPRSRVNPDRVVISTNLKLRQDGLPYSAQREPEDPGVAVYFELDKERRCIPSDKWDRVADNIAGIAAAIGALRGIERWVNDANVRAAFKGFAALPDPNRVDWYAVFGFKRNGTPPTADEVRAKHRTLSFEQHPDRGGSAEAQSLLNRARDQALAELTE